MGLPHPKPHLSPESCTAHSFSHQSQHCSCSTTFTSQLSRHPLDGFPTPLPRKMLQWVSEQACVLDFRPSINMKSWAWPHQCL